MVQGRIPASEKLATGATKSRAFAKPLDPMGPSSGSVNAAP